MPRIGIDQNPSRLRIGEGGYPKDREQLGAFAKLFDGMIAILTPEQRATLDPSALAVLDEIRACKARFPKEGRRKRKPKGKVAPAG